MSNGKKNLPDNLYVAYDERVIFEKRPDKSILYENRIVEVKHLEYIVFINVYYHQEEVKEDLAVLLLDSNTIGEKGLKALDDFGMKLSQNDGKSFEIRKTQDSPILKYAIDHNLRYFETLDTSYDIYSVSKCRRKPKVKNKKKKTKNGKWEQYYTYVPSGVRPTTTSPPHINTEAPSLNNNPSVSSKVEYKSLSFGGHKGYFYPDYHSRKGKD